MKDQFVQDEWAKLCERVVQTARYVDDRSNEQIALEQANEFCEQEPPERYTQLLDRIRGAAELAVSWQTNEKPEKIPVSAVRQQVAYANSKGNSNEDQIV